MSADIERCRTNLQDKSNPALYRALAEAENDAVISQFARRAPQSFESTRQAATTRARFRRAAT